MCISPGMIMVRGLQTAIACNNCWQCRGNKVRDLVGRCIAESRYAVATSVITLTYGTDRTVGAGNTTTLSAQILTYSDVQKWLKRLRRDGYPLRYVIAGEYGSAKGRAHWHVIAFWQERKPPHPPYLADGSVRWWDDPWWTRHPDSAGGHSHWMDFSPNAAAYVAKYVLKNEEDEKAQAFVRYSKKPLLGARFLEDLACRYVSAGLSPDRNRYSFGDVREKNGLPRQFTLTGASLDYFLGHYIEAWQRMRFEHPLDRQHSETVMAYMDRKAARMQVEDIERRRAIYGLPEAPVDLETGEMYPVYFDEPLNCFVIEAEGRKAFWTYDEWGNRSWQDAIGRVPATLRASVKNRPEASAELPSSDAYRRASQGT